MDVFDLSATLSLDTSKYEQGLNGAASMAKSMGSKVGSALKTATLVTGALVAVGTAVTGAFVGAAKKTADYGDKVDKMSQKIGISAEAYQKWDYVMQRAGTNIDSMKMGMKTLSQQAEKNSDAFQKLGISQEEVKELSQEDLFEKTVKGLSEMEQGTERTALASQLLGRAGADMAPLLNEGSEAIEEQMEIAEKYGMVMPDSAVKASAAFEDSLTTMQMTFTGLKNRMMGEFLPAMTQVTDGMAKLFAGDDSGAEDVANGIEGIIDKVGEMLPKVMEIGGKIAKHLGESFIKAIPDLLSTMTDACINIGKSVSETLMTSFSNMKTDGLVDVFGKMVDYLATQVPPMIEQLATTFADNAPMIAETGAEMMLKLGEGLVKALPTLISAAGQIVNGLLRVFIGIPVLLLAKGAEAGGAFVLGILKKANKAATAGAKMVSGVVNGLKSLAGKVASQAVLAVAKFVSQISSGVGKVKSAASKLAHGAVNAVKTGLSKIGDVGMNLVRGIWNGISSGTGWIKSKISGWVGNVKSFLKNLFGIASPSKWARDEIGKMIDAGLALGISNNADMVDDAFEDVMPEMDRSMLSSVNNKSSSKIISPVINLNTVVNGAEDPEQWADKLIDRMQLEARMA